MLSENNEKNIGLEGYLNDLFDCELFEFVPGATGKHIITAVGTDGVDAKLYDSNFVNLESLEPADDNVSFRITHELEQGETYYIIIEQKDNITNSTAYELYVEEPFKIVLMC